jgi:hypothetical protein
VTWYPWSSGALPTALQRPDRQRGGGGTACTLGEEAVGVEFVGADEDSDVDADVVGAWLGNRASPERLSPTPEPVPSVTLAQPAAVSAATSVTRAARPLISPPGVDRSRRSCLIRAVLSATCAMG